MSEITNRTRNYKNYERTKDVKVVNVTMPCSKCDGEMKFTGKAYFCRSITYNQHKCTKCDFEEEFFEVIYPRIEYVDIND